MKKGWVYKKLGEVCEIYQPTTIATSQLIPNGKYLVYGANGIIGRYNEYNHEEAEVLLCCRGATCGAINLSQPKSWVNGNAMVVKPKTNEIIKNFLIYLLTSLDYTHIITGAAQPQITRKSLFPVSIGLPPLSEQKEIVEYLDSSFAKIDKLKENAAKNLEEAKALFQSALKDALEPKEGWEEKNLGELSSLITKGASPKWQGFTYVESNGILFVTSENVREGYVSLEPAKYLNKEFNNKQKRSILKYNDLLINIVGASIGRAAIFRLNINDANINQAVALVRLLNNVDVDFINYILNSNIAWKQYDSLKKDSARANLSLENIRSLKIPLPPLSEQQSIVSYLDSLNEKVNTLQQNYSRICDECDALKQAILRQVFE